MPFCFVKGRAKHVFFVFPRCYIFSLCYPQPFPSKKDIKWSIMGLSGAKWSGSSTFPALLIILFLK